MLIFSQEIFIILSQRVFDLAFTELILNEFSK